MSSLRPGVYIMMVPSAASLFDFLQKRKSSISSFALELNHVNKVLTQFTYDWPVIVFCEIGSGNNQIGKC